MKIGMLILLVSATGFAATSAVLMQRVRADRAEVTKVEQQHAGLTSRVKALEQERDQLQAEVQHLRVLVSDPPREQQPVRSASRTEVSGGTSAVARAGAQAIRFRRLDARGNAVEPGETTARVWSTFPTPEPTPAMRKMMRNQMKQSLRRQYEDLGPELGLDAEQSAQLIDLIADQHTRSMYQSWPQDAEGQADMRRKMQEAQRQQRAELAKLIGESKLPSFDEYQRTLPARSEVFNLQEQLAAADVPMRPEQRKALTASVLEEVRTYPRPDFSPGLAPEDFRAQMNQWEEQHQQRLLESAERVLNAEQLAVFRDYQDYQRDMRRQFATMMPVAAEGAEGANGVVTGSVTFVGPAPATKVP